MGGIGDLQSLHQRQCVSAHKVESLDSKGNVLAHIKQKRNSLAAKNSNSPMLRFGLAKWSKHKANIQQQHPGTDTAFSLHSVFQSFTTKYSAKMQRSWWRAETDLTLGFCCLVWFVFLMIRISPDKPNKQKKNVFCCTFFPVLLRYFYVPGVHLYHHWSSFFFFFFFYLTSEA